MHPRSRSPQASFKPYERSTWEQNLVKTTLKALNSVQPDNLGQRIGTVGQYIATYTDSEQGRTLKIVDANGERGILYKIKLNSIKLKRVRVPQLTTLPPVKSSNFTL